MKKEIKFEIGDKAEFLAVIDEIGDLQTQVESLRKQIGTRLASATAWALEHPHEAFERGGCGATERYDYGLEAASRALRRLPGVSQEQVVALLSADETMAGYVYSAYDTKQIGEDYGGNAKKRESVKAFGLCFTEPGKGKLVVRS